MSEVKYSPDLADKDPQESLLPDLEIVRLRTEIAGLKKQLEIAQQILKENGLEEVGPTVVSDEEQICVKQIGILKQLSDKGLPFANEDVKNLEILVKTLLAIRGKAPVEAEKKTPKKKGAPSVADLLSIVKANPKAE